MNSINRNNEICFYSLAIKNGMKLCAAVFSVLFFFRFLSASELLEFRKNHNTYFITRAMFKKGVNAFNVYDNSIENEKIADLLYLAKNKSKKNQDNALIDCPSNPNYHKDDEVQHDVIRTVDLDNQTYEADDAYGKTSKIVINVTMNYIQEFLVTSHQKDHPLSKIITYNCAVRGLLSRASQDQDVKNLLYCFQTHLEPCDKLNVKSIKYKELFDKVVESYKRNYYYRNFCGTVFWMILLLYFTDTNNMYILATTIFGECLTLFFIKNHYYKYLQLCTEYEKLKNSEEWQNIK